MWEPERSSPGPGLTSVAQQFDVSARRRQPYNQDGLARCAAFGACTQECAVRAGGATSGLGARHASAQAEAA